MISIKQQKMAFGKTNAPKPNADWKFEFGTPNTLENLKIKPKTASTATDAPISQQKSPSIKSSLKSLALTLGSIAGIGAIAAGLGTIIDSCQTKAEVKKATTHVESYHSNTTEQKLFGALDPSKLRNIIPKH